MQCVTRPRITELNPHLLCVLCGGYYIDATAIIECLHSFCKSCIIRYLETRKYCPICDVLVHKTKPLQNLRPDTVLQSIVYKLVPNLYEKEMRNRRCYYSKVPTSHHPQTAEEKGVITESSKFYSNSDSIDFSLEYVNYSDCNFYVATNSQRYFRCQACVTIEQLRKLIEAKYSTTDEHQTRFFYNEIQLPEHLTLLDLAYMSAWKRRGFIRILYEIQVKKILIESNLKSTSSSSTTVVESVEEIPPSIPVTSSSSSSCPPDSSAIENDSTKTETSSEPPSSDVVALPKPTKESSPTPAASTVATATAAVVTTTTTCASTASAVPDEKEIAITSSSVSTIASSSSNLSLTVTCSMNSDDITTSSVGAPITTSVCLPSVNGLSPSPPKVVTPAPSPRATTTTERVEPKQKSQPEIPAAAAAEESPKTAKNSAAAVVVVEKVKPPTPPTSSTPSKKPEVTKEKSRPPVPSAVKRPLEESEKSTPQKPVAETSPKPAKIPKLSGLAEKVLSANKSPSGLTIEVRKSASVAPTTSATTTAVSSTPTPSLTVTSVSVSVPKASVTVSPVSRVDAVQKCSPRSIYNRVEAPPPTQPPHAITKSSTKIIKSFNRPWNSTSSHQQQQQQRPAIPDLIDVSTGQAVKSSTTKIIKARPTTAPRYQPSSSSSSNRSVYESPSVPPLTTPTSKSTIVDPDAKKTAVASSKMFPVMKIDPQTLSPILAAVAAATATSSTSTTIASISPSISSASKKSSYSPFLPPSVTAAAAAASELYTNSGPFPSSGGGGLSTYTSPNLTTKPPGSYVMPNSLLPINQFMYEMYGNGTRTLEYMKAMTTNICQSSLFHPSLLPPSMGPSASFYNSMQKYEKKYEKKSSSSSSSPRLPKGPPSSTTNQQRQQQQQQQQQSPPSVQRIPPSNNNTKLAISEHSSGEKKPVPTAVDKHESVSNGQLKHKTKKTDASGGGGGGSSFSINNLIPLEIEKRATSGVSHTCSADGVHQVCDQMPSTTTKNKLTTDSKETTETNKRTAAAESKLNNTTSKKESEERK